MAPNRAAAALPAMTAGMSGTTMTLASGATSETCSNVASSTGRVASWAATVSATGVRIHAGKPGEARLEGSGEHDQPARRQRGKLEPHVPQ